MNRELFKETYHRIYLTENQKNKIWNQLEDSAENKRARIRTCLSFRVAVCASVLLLSGMTVFAAGNLSIAEKIATAMDFLTGNDKELTDDRKSIYEQYGNALDNEIPMEHGTLRLEAALYDEHYLLIPFTFHPTEEFALTAGETIENTPLYQTLLNTELSEPSIYADQKKLSTGSRFTTLNPEVTADGTLTGSYLLSIEKEVYETGDNIRIARTETSETGDITEQLLSSFTLENMLDCKSIPVDASLFQAKEASGDASPYQLKGITVDSVTLSPLSLCFTGTMNEEGKACSGQLSHLWFYNTSIIQKDGEPVTLSRNGGCYVPAHINESGDSTYTMMLLFDSPMLLTDVSGIRIRHTEWDVDLWIPIE